MLATLQLKTDYRNANRATALKSRHQTLEGQIAQEAGRPLPDDLAIRRLKQRRLLLKEQLAALQATD